MVARVLTAVPAAKTTIHCPLTRKATRKPPDNACGGYTWRGGHDESRKRWAAKRRVGLIVEILRGYIGGGSGSETCLSRRRGVWRERFFIGAENALRRPPAPRTQPPTPEDSAATATRRLAAWGSTDVYQVSKSSGCCGYMRIFPHLRRDQGGYTEFSVSVNIRLVNDAVLRDSNHMWEEET